MIYINEKCGRCGESLNGWAPDYRAIGIPFVKCGSCGAINNRSEKATEWSLMTSGRKFVQVFLAAWWAFVLGTFVFFILGIILIKIYPSIGESEFLGAETLLIWVPSCIVVGIWSFSRLYKEIRKSGNRLKEHSYLNELKKLGLIE